MHWGKVRLSVLLILVTLLSGKLLIKNFNQALPWFVQCNERLPSWLPMLTKLIRNLDYPGYQLSIRETSGKTIHCAAGWAGSGLTLAPLRTDHRLRYASLSKIFTSVVASQLIAEGLLDGNHSFVTYLEDELRPIDPRIRDITLEQLLRHTAGFDRNVTPDPMMQASPWCPARLKVLQKVVLDHEPGSYYAYSNLGYCLLGAVIEQVEDMPLEEVFQARIFSPAGINSISLAETGKYHPKEPRYKYRQPDTEAALLDMPYSHMVATGGWIGTSSDFLQMLTQAFSANGRVFMDIQSQALLLAVSPGCDVRLWRTCHGNGLYLYQPNEGGPALYWRDGSLPGVTSFTGFIDGGAMFVFLSNGRSYHWLEANDRIGQFLYRHIAEH